MDSDTGQLMKTSQPTLPLIDNDQPGALECSGAELITLLASLKARGAIVCGMASVCVSRWRLSIHWPQQSPVGK
jgi:hypothetical protein